MKLITILALAFAILLAAAGCSNDTSLPGQPSSGDGGNNNAANSSAPATPTIDPNVTPLSVASTNTPVPPPPTPTPRPSSTPAPTNTPAPTQAGATAAPTATQAPSQLLTNEMIAIPAGSFMMGSDSSPDAKPPYKVDVAAFSLDKFEVSNGDFKQFVTATSYQTDAEKAGEKGWTAFADGKDDHPVVKVSWNDANAFCKWAGERLPTEAEWEYAARGKDALAFPYGNTFDPKNQNGKDSGVRGTTAVGSYPAGASPFGVLDMAGNVWEWTNDVAKHYPGNTNQSKLYGDNLYIVRGGGWFDTQDHLTTFNRNSATAVTANDDLGFRCAK